MQTKHARTTRMRRLMQAGILLCLMVMAGCAKDENLLDNENFKVYLQKVDKASCSFDNKEKLDRAIDFLSKVLPAVM